MLHKLFKHSLLWLIFIVIFFVLCFSVVPSYKQFQKSFNGDSEKIKYPGFSKKSLQSHEFQKYTETLFEKNIRLRKKLISFNNQIYYALFKKSFAENSTLVIGKNKQFYELHYILDHCSTRKELSELPAWADKIAELNQYFTSKGKTFIYVITPSKAEHMPNTIPDRFHCKNVGIKDAVYQMDKLLTERHVTHINGPYLMIQTMNKYKMDVFPPGGIHWNWLGSTVEAAAIVEALKLKTKLPLPQIQFTYTMGKPQIGDTDRDILAVAQLWEKSFNYKVPQIHFENPVYAGKPITLSVIGGSFNWSLNKIFLKNKIFSEVNYYFYFNRHEKFFKPDQKLEWSTNIEIADILKSDVIILEENSAILVSDHGKRFFEKMTANHA